MRSPWFRFLRCAITLWVTLPLCSVTAPQNSRNCHDALGIPCATLVYERSQWQLWTPRAGWFVHNSDRQTLAHRSDGSSAFWSYSGSYVSLYAASLDQVIQIDHRAKTVSHRPPIIWHDRPYRRAQDGDRQCASGILHSGTDFHWGGEVEVAGISVQKWERGDGWFWQEEEFLAPSLDCATLKYNRIRWNRWLIPVWIDSMEVESVRRGEPDPSLFDVPTYYQEVKDPQEAWLRQFVTQNGPSH